MSRGEIIRVAVMKHMGQISCGELACYLLDRRTHRKFDETVEKPNQPCPSS